MTELESLEPTFTLAKLVLIAIVLIALLCAHFLTATERRLVAGTALILAGMFFLTRGGEPVIAASGVVTVALGAVVMVRAALAWNQSPATPAGVIATLVLLPPATFGAVMLTGVVLTFLMAPIRLVIRILGG